LEGGLPTDLRALILAALRAQAGTGPHSETARQVLLALLLAQLLAAADHAGPPHVTQRPPRQQRPRRRRMPRHESLSGRRPRG
jgi:hypothetical protein